MNYVSMAATPSSGEVTSPDWEGRPRVPGGLELGSLMAAVMEALNSDRGGAWIHHMADGRQAWSSALTGKGSGDEKLAMGHFLHNQNLASGLYR